ncbi:MAG: RidA family protein [Rhodospirillales bacterium]|nr:RidA family protein [Rhodospirillales bacterium]
MTDSIHSHLKELGIELPEPMQPVATYVPYVISGNLLYTSGQGPVLNGEFKSVGKLGDNLTVEQGYEASRLTALNILSQANAALDGNLDRIVRCVKLFGLVNCTPDFTDQPKVINGASDLMVKILGDKGKHCRAAVGAPSLPFDTSVEIDGIFEILL